MLDLAFIKEQRLSIGSTVLIEIVDKCFLTNRYSHINVIDSRNHNIIMRYNHINNELQLNYVIICEITDLDKDIVKEYIKYKYENS